MFPRRSDAPLIALGALFLASVAAGAEDAAKPVEKATSAVPVNLTVFYETHCPDSQKFLVKQVAPALDKFGSSLNVTLVPFGFASYNVVDEKLSFTCQHGQKECEGNTYHACAVRHANSTEQAARFAICTMSHEMLVLDFIQECADKHKLVTSDLRACATSDAGLQLLRCMGDRTKAAGRLVNPEKERLATVPTFFLDGKQSTDEDVKDLVAHICKHAVHKPPQCAAA